MKGCETGDGEHLKAAFHPDARMFGALGADRYDVPVFGGMDAAVAGQPVGQYKATGFWGQEFVDYFLLSRTDDEWQIVAKSFAHLGAGT